MTDSMLQILVQGGSVSIALVLVFVLYKIVTNHGTHFQDSLDRNSEAWIKNAEAMGKLTQVIEEKLK